MENHPGPEYPALDGRCVQADLAHLGHAGFPTDTKKFEQNVLKLLTVVLAEVADRAEVELLIRGKIAKRDITFEKPTVFVGAADTDTVVEDENVQYYHGMEGRPSGTVFPVLWTEGIKLALIVEMIDDSRDVAFEAIPFDPFCDVFRQELYN